MQKIENLLIISTNYLNIISKDDLEEFEFETFISNSKATDIAASLALLTLDITNYWTSANDCSNRVELEAACQLMTDEAVKDTSVSADGSSRGEKVQKDEGEGDKEQEEVGQLSTKP